VAEHLCALLVEHGISVLFGHPGGAILPFYDALHRLGSPRHVLMRHEQSAAHAADGYARATGRVGVCVATSGPGATNLVTGLATAMMDGVPVLALTGQVARTARGLDSFQEVDVLGITMPVTKHGFIIDDPSALVEVVAEALAIAVSGRPGPVLIDVPKDVQAAPAAPARPRRHPPLVPRLDPPREEAVTRAAELLNNAKRPLIMAGRGVTASETTGTMRRMAEAADLPVVTTLLGLDAFPATHALSLGMPGMHGTERANRAIQEADVILGLGLRFDDRVIGRADAFAPHASVIHADIEPASVGRSIQPAVELIGDLRDTLPRIAAEVRPARHGEWRARVRTWSRDCTNTTSSPEQEPDRLTGRAASRALAARIANSRATVATDVGQHQMFLAQELGAADPGTHLTSGGLGTMGFALPAALGAAVGRPDRPTWVVAGDGGFQMTIQELATVVQEGLPLRIAVMNNGFLGLVRQWQELYYARRYSASALSGPDLVALAKAYGIPARAVAQADKLEEALDWAEAADGPVLLDLQVTSDENVFPVVPPGASLSEIQTGQPRLAIL
jgi:acetolactate synthase-1/2/3 large subunit